MLGQIRLQWWRENIAAAFAGGPVRHHPVLEALTGVIRELPLTRDHFDRLIDAREADLAEEPPASLTALEDYTEATSARLIYLALEVLGVHNSATREAARDIGIAYAFAGLLRAMAFHARAGRRIIPTDVIERAGLSEQDYRALRSPPALHAATAELAMAAFRHLEAARVHPIHRAALPALLPAVIARRSLTRLKRAEYDPFDQRLAAPDPLQSWRLATAVVFNRF
jgi:phytoene synthase